ncbi:MAG: glycosyltransferase family 2 protein [Bacteroidales bacterium]
MENGGRRIKEGLEKAGQGKKPLITIITAVFNGERYLARAIESVKRLSFRDIEYIIIDGGSTDATLSIIKSYEDFVDLWISEPDKGISDAFNKGIKESHGDYIAFLNCDDWYEEDALSSVIRTLDDDMTIVCGSINLISGVNSESVKVHRSDPGRLNQTMRIAHPASIVPSKLFSVVGLFSEDLPVAMDYDLFLRAKIAGFRFSVTEVIITNHQLGGVSSDFTTVLRYEKKVKDKNLGKRISHLLWYLLNLTYYRISILYKS